MLCLWLQLRGLGGGAAATCNWITNAVVSQTFLTLIQHLGGSGTFWLYAVIALAGALWVYFALPETNGRFHVSLCFGGMCSAVCCAKGCTWNQCSNRSSVGKVELYLDAIIMQNGICDIPEGFEIPGTSSAQLSPSSLRYQ